MMAKLAQIVLMATLYTVLLTEASAGSIPGGWKGLNVTDPEVQAVATEAAAHLETVRNSGKVYRLNQVISAKSRVVRGLIYQLILTIGETNCVRETNVDVDDCYIVAAERCLVVVWIWQDTSDFLNFTCREEKRQPSGGIRVVDVDREDVQQVATFAAEELTGRSNGRYRVEHRCISKATHQVVAGGLYRLTMVVDVTSVDDEKSKTVRCRVNVWDQAWRTPRFTLEEYKCNRLIS